MLDEPIEALDLLLLLPLLLLALFLLAFDFRLPGLFTLGATLLAAAYLVSAFR